MNTLVIIGTGLAGYTLAKEFRKLDAARPLLLITADDGRNYSKPMLSTGFARQKTADELAMNTPDEMAAQLNAAVRTGAVVEQIDTAARSIRLKGGETIGYGDLVLAWGADVFRVPIEGDAAAEVLSINDLADYGVFRAKAQGRRRVLVIGAGLIGSEFANDLASGGFAVDVVDPAGRCLAALLPPEASAAVARGLEGVGVRFHFGVAVKGVDRSGDGYRCTLTDGSTVDTDVVMSAVGLRPRIALAKAAGLAVNRGIVVDTQLRASAPHVHALGDCAEVNGYVLPYVLPLMAAARALAKTLAGTPAAVSYGVMPVTVKTPACPVVVCPPPLGAQGSWQVEGSGQDIKALYTGADGTPLGFALTGAATGEKQALAKLMPALF
jgi:rubredoxin-NAD+ reductase